MNTRSTRSTNLLLPRVAELRCIAGGEQAARTYTLLIVMLSSSMLRSMGQAIPVRVLDEGQALHAAAIRLLDKIHA